MSVLLQTSDTHFGTEQPQVGEAFVALATQQRPDVVLLSGDITHRVLPAQFRAAKAFVDRLGASVLAIPGNHDMRAHNPLHFPLSQFSGAHSCSRFCFPLMGPKRRLTQYDMRFSLCTTG